MHRKRGALDSPRIVADAKETACTRVISSPYRITESAEIPSRLNPLPNPALLGFQSVEIQASWRAKAQVLERDGLPRIDPVMGGRYWPAVRAFWNKRYGLSTVEVSQPDGGEHLDALR